MVTLIPFNETAAAELEESFSQSKFRSADFFIDFYNSGLVNKAADEVVQFAQEVDATFKNVKLQGKNLVFISTAEVELDEILPELKKWEVLVKVRDRLTSLVAEGVITSETVLRFSGKSAGVLEQVTSTEGGENHYEKLVDEKFFKPAEEELVEEALRKYRSTGAPHSFLAKDLLDLDDSFISQIHKILFS